jgi:alkaline phosphatase D
MDAKLGYPLYDLTSSGLNMGNKRWRPMEVNKHRVATMMSGDNFGLVLIDWDATPPVVRLQIRDVAGEVVIGQRIELPLLSPKPEPVASGKPSPAAPPKTPGAISTSEAAKLVGERVTVEFKVKATGKTRDGVRVFLNSTVERNDADNFTIVLMMREMGDALKEAKVADPTAYYKGKTVRVTGTVSLYQDRPQIVVQDASMIGVVPAD